MSTAEAPAGGSEFVDFWNEILVPKFIKYRHILVGGLTHHSGKKSFRPSKSARAIAYWTSDPLEP